MTFIVCNRYDCEYNDEQNRLKGCTKKDITLRTKTVAQVGGVISEVLQCYDYKRSEKE